MTDTMFTHRYTTSAHLYSLRMLSLFTIWVAVALAGCSQQAEESPEAVAARNQALDAKLNALNIDVNIAEFDRILGKPSSQSQREITSVTLSIRRHARPKRVEEKFTYNEYFYLNDHYVVQALTDASGKVGMYTVTAVHKGYLPKLNTIFAQPVQLGKTLYSEMASTVRKIAVDLSAEAQTPAYYEIQVTTGPEPQIAGMATNPAGYVGKIGTFEHDNKGLFVKWFSLTGNDFPLNEMHDNFRKNTTINTYMRAAQWFRGVDNSADGANFGASAINFGPSAAQLKALK